MTVGGTREGVDARDRGLHESRTGARSAGRQARRHLGVRLCALRDAQRAVAPSARDTISDTIATILEREADFTAVPAITPSAITRLLQRCLTKDPRRRVRDIGDARAEFDLPTPDRPNDVDSRRQPASDADAGLESAVRIQPAIVPAWKTMRRWMWPVAAVVCAALVVTSLWLTRPDTVPSEIPSQFTLTLEEQMGAAPPEEFPVPSPDGRHVVFLGGSAGFPPLYGFAPWIRSDPSLWREQKAVAGHVCPRIAAGSPFMSTGR